jgi:hypothetical protein
VQHKRLWKIPVFPGPFIYTSSVQTPATFYVTISGLYKMKSILFPVRFSQIAALILLLGLGSDSLIYEEKPF